MDFSVVEVGGLRAISIGARSARERFAKAIEKFLVEVLRWRTYTCVKLAQSDRQNAMEIFSREKIANSYFFFLPPY